MGVADQMLLNQVTIFNPPSPYTTPTSYTSHSSHVDNTECKPFNEPIYTHKYAFGWQDPREIYYG